jgi:hypothetical protein
MGERREPRKEIRLPVRIFGTDASGKAFSENVFTVNVSQHGARLVGVRSQIKVGEIIGLTCGNHKGRFCVKWVGQAGTLAVDQIGLQNLSPEKPLWDTPVPPAGIDEYGRQTKATERRKHPRLKCMNSVELHVQGQAAPIWGKAVDLSLGGCFVEMPIPLKEGAKLKMGLWIEQNKLWANAKVASSRPGFGIGIQFTEIPPEDLERLKQFLKSITRMPI